MNSVVDLFPECERPPELEEAVSRMAGQCETDRGAVFTRPEVVQAILDLAGYRPARALHRLRLLEPSFGRGDFLLPAIGRLWQAFVDNGGTPGSAVTGLRDAVRGVELHQSTFDRTSQLLAEQLGRWGISARDSKTLLASWLIRDDFLLTRLDRPFDFVIGNPPYVRQERIPNALLREYRRRFSTLFDRADLYVPFFERGLDLLGDHGVLGYICANRWLKNRYGGPLREKISRGYWLKYFVDMEQTDAFHTGVIAYPAITVLQRASPGHATGHLTRVVDPKTMGDTRGLSGLVDALLGHAAGRAHVQEIEIGGSSSAPLLLDDIPRIALLRRIEHEFPAIEQAACKVGIGVATGCDEVFIRPMDALPVEPTRTLPLVMAHDLVDGKISWGGNGVLNPFDDEGHLVALDAYPRFARYLEAHRDQVTSRHVAKRNPGGWYRTIDRIRPGLLRSPKLLVPDIKGTGVFIIDQGCYYPHHNLYFITSKDWDLRALQTVLRSSLTLMTVATYCTRMSGGFLRFQAQYLRRIRLPPWRSVSDPARKQLIAAHAATVQSEVDLPVFELYGLSHAEAHCARRIAQAARTGKDVNQ